MFLLCSYCSTLSFLHSVWYITICLFHSVIVLSVNILFTNVIGGVIVSVHASSEVHHVFEPRSGQAKHLVFAASVLNMQH